MRWCNNCIVFLQLSVMCFNDTVIRILNQTERRGSRVIKCSVWFLLQAEYTHYKSWRSWRTHYIGTILPKIIYARWRSCPDKTSSRGRVCVALLGSWTRSSRGGCTRPAALTREHRRKRRIGPRLREWVCRLRRTRVSGRNWRGWTGTQGVPPGSGTGELTLTKVYIASSSAGNG